MMVVKQVVDQAHDLTQPVVLSIGSAVVFGLTVDEIIKMGTLCLMLLNIPLAALRIWEQLGKKKKDE